MQTHYWNLQTDTDGAALREAAALIKKGEAVAFPTETVYGLGADGLNGAAVRKIFEAKGRPSDNPLILHIAGKKDILKLTSGLTKQAEILIDKFWPGPLTVIVAKSGIVPDEVSARMPSHPVAAELIRLAGTPIAAPSANISGKPSPTDAETVLADMQGRIAGIVDGGACEVGVESTIVDTTGEVPVILRPGGITREQLEAVLGKVELDPALAGVEAAKPKAPGMKYRHYAPKASMYVVEGEALKKLPLLAKEAAKFAPVAVICGGEVAESMQRTQNLHILNWGSGETDLAVKLYRMLRRCDKLGVQLIFSEGVTEDGIGLAVMNRMRKAAGRQVLTSDEIEALLKNSSQLKSFVLK